ncbi:MAG: pyridoxal phosphate-dependent aminotransferase, partial [Candidatus Bathyarchaeota archaeon]|nr:pyridoxal phosphate-dependent aminotransferase [Candidatus Bathyarchaeota archaeon]
SSQGVPELRSTIATELSQKHDCTISAEQVLITPSGKFAVFAAIVSMISLGDRVLIPEPSWPIYENCTRLVGGRVDSIHARLEDDWMLNMEQLEEALAVKPKLLIVCNPNNPTGKIVSETDLKEICQLAEAQGTVVLSDETHSAYTFTTSTSILDVTDSNFVYVDNFSKIYGLKGERIGYAVSNLETTTRMNRLLQLSVAYVPEFVQRAVLNDLPLIQQNVEAFMKEMDERIELACKELINYPLLFTRPEGGIHIFPRTNIEDFDSRMFTKTLLSKKKVAVVPGEAFGEYPEHFRLSLGTNKRDIKEGVKRIGALLEEWL